MIPVRYLVVGAAGHGQEVAWSLREELRALGESEAEIAFLDDAVRAGSEVACGLGPVLGGVELARREAARANTRLVMGVGLPRTKAAIVRRLDVPEHVWTPVVHPSAIVGPNVTMGVGTYVGPGAVLTVNVQLGRFVTINTHCLVAHGGVLGDFATLHPDAHLSGDVAIGQGCEVGAGSIVIPGLTVGEWAVLGAGAVAVDHVSGGRTHVGVPARELVRGAVPQRPLPLPLGENQPTRSLTRFLR
ncbi:NeuD/PglB/VioB family sugar acetyltransferase [Candidatus Binatia bacterium]|nr:NeuD/PglB/VioB family sugar acetyltransferase [Candidatus Binatia bacterium]